MAYASSPLAKHPHLSSSHPRNPNTRQALAPPPPPIHLLHLATPAVAEAATARRVQDKVCAKCGNSGYSGHVVTRCQCKRAPGHQHRATDLIHKTKGRISGPGSSDNHRMHRFSTSMSSKSGAKVKQIPAEDISYVQRGKPFGRRFNSTALQNQYYRRSVTPPPSSRIVSVLKPASPSQKPMPSAWSVASRTSPKRLSTSENGKSFGRYCATPSLTPQTVSLKKPASPSCKPVPLALSIETFPDTNAGPSSTRLSTIDNGKSFGTSCNSSSLQCQGQRSGRPLSSLQTELVTKPTSPSSKSVLAAQSIEPPLDTKVGSSPKSLSTAEIGKSFRGSCHSTAFQGRYPRSATPPASLRTELTMKPTLLSPKSVLTERSTDVSPDTKAGPSPSGKPFSRKCKSTSFQSGHQSNGTHPASLQTELVMKVTCHDAKAGPSPKGHNSADKGKSFGTSCNNIALQRQGSIESAPPPASLQTELIKPTSPSPQSMPLARSIEVPNDTKAGPSTKSSLITAKHGRNKASTKENISAADIVCSEVRSEHFDYRQMDRPVMLSTKPHEKLSQQKVCWKGAFEVIGEATHYEAEAHFPCEIFVKVYEVSKQMPEILKLETLPLSDVWPKMFKLEPPNHNDIGLYFSSNLQRSNRNFHCLLKKISSHVCMRTYIGNIELVIYSSELLPTDCQRRDGKFYLWGVFRRCKKQLRNKRSQSCSSTSDMKTNKSTLSNENFHNERVQILDTPDLNVPPGFTAHTAPPFFPACDTPPGRAIDAHPSLATETTGFATNVAPSFTETNSQFPTDSPQGSAARNASPGFATCGAPSGFAAQNDFPGLSACDTPDHAIDAPPSLSTKNPGFPINVHASCKEAHPEFPSLGFAICGAPPGFAARDVSSGFAACHTLPRHTIDSPLNLSTKSPGFPINVPSSSTGAHPPIPTDAPPGSAAQNASPGFARCGAPPGSAAQNASRFARCGAPPGSAAQNASRFAACGTPCRSTDAPPSLALDTPPGFPIDVPPGFTEAHRRFPTRAPAGSATDSSPSFPCSSTPCSEKKPLIKFALKVSRPDYPEVPPGFINIPRLKQELGSPASDKITKNKKSASLASGKSSIRIAGKAVEMKIEHHEVKGHPKMPMGHSRITSPLVKMNESFSQEEPEFQKTRLLSDILGLPSTSAMENTRILSEMPTLENCSKVGRSIAVPLSHQFQERETPEKQKHAGKRDLEEACHPSPADTTKRYKVNGRIALNKCSDGPLGKAARVCQMELQKNSVGKQVQVIDPDRLNSKQDQGKDKMRCNGTPASGVMALRLFPVADIKDQRDAISTVSRDISPELSLSLPRYVMNGNLWVPAISNNLLGPQDGSEKELRLSL